MQAAAGRLPPLLLLTALPWLLCQCCRPKGECCCALGTSRLLQNQVTGWQCMLAAASQPPPAVLPPSCGGWRHWVDPWVDQHHRLLLHQGSPGRGVWQETVPRQYLPLHHLLLLLLLLGPALA